MLVIHLMLRSGRSTSTFAQKLSSDPKTIMYIAQAICSSFLKKFKNTILKFQKKLKLNIQVDNVVIYNRANFQVKIPYSLSCAKMTNSKIYNSEQCRFLKSHNLSKFVIFVQPRILGIWSSNFTRC
jgi:hypothetical protein